MADLTTLANVKAWLNVKTSTDDTLLDRLISACSTFVQSWLNRQILTATSTEVRHGEGGTRLLLANYPVTAVQSLTINGRTIPPAADSTSPGYLFDDMEIALVGYEFCRGNFNVQVEYTAGFATVPLDIEQAVIETIGLRYKEKDRIGQNSISQGGQITTSFMIKDLTPATLTTLTQYRRVVPL